MDTGFFGPCVSAMLYHIAGDGHAVLHVPRFHFAGADPAIYHRHCFVSK